jgi:uncharacterized protein
MVSPKTQAKRRALLQAGATIPLFVPQLSAAQVPSRDAVVTNPARELLGLGKPETAVLLPPSNGSFGWASQALRAGLVAAHQRDGQQKPFLLIEVEDRQADIFSIVSELKSQAVQWLAGPLTRQGVNNFIDSGTQGLKSLTLNVPDADRFIPNTMLTFGLPVEAEARQIGQYAFDQAGLAVPTRRPLRALALAQANPSSRRAAASFTDTLRELGADVPLPFEIEGRVVSEVKNAVEQNQPDALFLSAPLEVLRTIRGAIDKNVPLYSTSQASLLGNANARLTADLDGIWFVDVTWLAVPDHAVVQAYPKVPARFTAEMIRLYALGLDTYRLLFDVLPYPNRKILEGATGKLVVNTSAQRIDRAGSILQYRAGQAFVVG